MGNVDSTAFPYTLQNQISSYHSAIGWTLHNAIHTTTGDKVSIFAFDKTKNPSKVECARNGMTMLRQLRHPFVLKYISCVEQPNVIYIVTEQVIPLLIPFMPQTDDPHSALTSTSSPKSGLSGSNTTNYNSNDTAENNVAKSTVLTSSSLDLHLKPLPTSSPESINLLLSAGLHQLYTAIEFLNTRAGIVHGNINPSSVFIGGNGDWKLGGFDLAFKTSPPSSIPSSSSTTPGQNSQQTEEFLDFDGEGVNMGSNGTKNGPNGQNLSQTGQKVQNGSISGAQDTLGVISLAFRSHYSSQDKLYIPPDVLSNAWKKLEGYPIYVIDSYAMGVLLKQLLCPSQSSSSSSSSSSKSSTHTQNLFDKKSPSLTSPAQGIPALLLNDFRLYYPGATSSSAAIQAVEMTTLLNLPSHSKLLSSPYFNNHVIAALAFLDQIHIKSVEEKTAFFTQFSTIYTMFPTSVLKNRIIPQLILSFDVISPKTAGSSFPGILNSTFAVSKVCLPLDEYNKIIVPLIKKLFQSPDFDIRLSLLHSLKEFAQFLTVDMVFNDILPTIIVGVSDPNPIIRELTVIGLISFFPHFLRAKDGKFDTTYNNIAIMSNKVAYDAYNYASATVSMVSNYLGYQGPNGQGGGGEKDSNNTFSSSSSASSTSSTLTPMSSLSSSHLSSSNPSQSLPSQSSQSSQSSQQSNQTINPHLYTLPSLYLTQIVFPTLINHFPEEVLPQIRASIILTATALSPLLPQSSQETILLTIYAKGMKDSGHGGGGGGVGASGNNVVKLTSLDGLIITMLTSSFTIQTLCNKIIPFTCPYICERDFNVAVRAIFVLQYALFKIQKHYGVHNFGPNSQNSQNPSLLSSNDNNSNNNLNIGTVLQSYPTRYPMLQLDMAHLSQQMTLSIGNNNTNGTHTSQNGQSGQNGQNNGQNGFNLSQNGQNNQNSLFSSNNTQSSMNTSAAAEALLLSDVNKATGNIGNNNNNNNNTLNNTNTTTKTTASLSSMNREDQMNAMFPDLVVANQSNVNTSNGGAANGSQKKSPSSPSSLYHPQQPQPAVTRAGNSHSNGNDDDGVDFGAFGTGFGNNNNNNNNQNDNNNNNFNNNFTNNNTQSQQNTSKPRPQKLKPITNVDLEFDDDIVIKKPTRQQTQNQQNQQNNQPTSLDVFSQFSSTPTASATQPAKASSTTTYGGMDDDWSSFM